MDTKENLLRATDYIKRVKEMRRSMDLHDNSELMALISESVEILEWMRSQMTSEQINSDLAK